MKPDIKHLHGGRFYGTYGNWHISNGEDDDMGRPPRNAVYYCHDSMDKPYTAMMGWASSIDDAVLQIDAKGGPEKEWD